MAKKNKKKKNKKKGQQKKPQRQLSPQAVKKEDTKAIKSMIIGAISLSLFIAFFALDISGSTMYERLTSLFDSDSSPPQTTQVKR